MWCSQLLRCNCNRSVRVSDLVPFVEHHVVPCDREQNLLIQPQGRVPTVEIGHVCVCVCKQDSGALLLRVGLVWNRF